MLDDITVRARGYGREAVLRLAEIMRGNDPGAATEAAKVLLDRGFGKAAMPLEFDASGVHVEVNTAVKEEPHRANGESHTAWGEC
jgi:glycine cleavage system H lipoate-binding protein